MQNLLSTLIWPVIVGIVLLIIEYFVAQPIRKANKTSLPVSINQDWTKAIEIAVKRFKTQQTGFIWNWWSSNKNKITIEDFSISKGQATLHLAIWKNIQIANTLAPGVAILDKEARIIAKYELVIDRTGDTLKIKSIQVN